MKTTKQHYVFLIGITAILSGCAELTPVKTVQEELRANGYIRLDAEQIESTLTGHTLHGKFGTYTATVYLGSRGVMLGKTVSTSGSVRRDQGTWKTSPEGLFCDSWNNWRAGSDCDYVFVKGDNFVLINLDGSLSSEGKIENGNTRDL